MPLSRYVSTRVTYSIAGSKLATESSSKPVLACDCIAANCLIFDMQLTGARKPPHPVELRIDLMSIAFFTDEDARGPILVHYHIFKNAGSTVEYALRREFHEFFSTFEGPHPNSILTYDQLVEFVKSNPLLRAVSSHHLRYPTLRDDLRPVIDICVLRHPLDRLFSVYRFLREKYSGKSDLLHQAASELGCAAFFRQCLEKYPAWMRNVQVGILGPGDPSSAPAALAELSRIALLATTDFFDESLVVWEYALFPVFPGISLHYLAQNVTHSTPSTLESRLEELRRLCGRSLYDELLGANAEDMQLYEVASRMVRERFHQRPDCNQWLEEFRERNRALAYRCRTSLRARWRTRFPKHLDYSSQD